MRLTAWGSLLMLAFLSPLCAGFIPDRNCTEEGLSITDGTYTLSKGMELGSLLIYKCKDGYYPSPTLSRRCQRRGRWSPAPDIKQPAECKIVTCPDPLTFANGQVFPNEMRYYVTNQTTYKCFDGYKQQGSKTRTCQSNGKWSGSTPICDSGTGYCADPGVPPGARRTGDHFSIDDKVTYRCDHGLTMMGASERMCQEDKEWTGMEPACYGTFTHDTPDEATLSFAASLSSSLSSVGDKTLHGKKVRLNQAGRLYIYIALDYSDSILSEHFDASKNCIMTLIEKISSFEITPKYEILGFATDVKEIVNIAAPNYKDIDIIKELDDFQYDGKGDRSGTNIAGAFTYILEKMSFLQVNDKDGFKDIQHVIIMFTDGVANMGGGAAPQVGLIRNMLDITKDREDFLDIYMFGVGPEVNKNEIAKLVSSKPNEQHFYILADFTSLEIMLDRMIDEDNSVGKCGLYRNYDRPPKTGTGSPTRQRHPWYAKVEIARSQETSSCSGALISPRFVLTAAHCFKFGDKEELIRVVIEDDKISEASKKIKAYRPHPKYKPLGKKDISEFYDYDVALIELEKDVKPSEKARPICIPCTEETSRALRLTANATCKDHEAILLKNDFEPAQFMDSHNLKLKNVSIKLGHRRDSCIEDVKKAKGINVADAKEAVTENFLCTGGIEDKTDHIACKGDSGGALFVERRRRLFQVGLVSFGVKNLCTENNYIPDSDSSSRDFHINLFKVRPFLKQYLGDGTQSYAPLKFID
ncbi:hypothetical protein AAFF_G00312750 [Aldrovandia affinis]|uniref:C3/C5 convertase n=1 Tax=Aldrovandia affinis TaxID=143900 RepID=A0AAD7WR13_9TELE|nr:hypothetical protein AAFF_G00312750 [Aldrovandia affinis]